MLSPIFGWRKCCSTLIRSRGVVNSDLKQSDIVVVDDFITLEQEKSLLEFVTPGLARRRYQGKLIGLFHIGVN